MSGVLGRELGRRLAGGALAAFLGFMMVGSVVAAQGAGQSQGAGQTEPAQGITVRGNGEAKANADSAVMQFIVRHDQSATSVDGQPDFDTGGKGVSGAEVTDQDMAPLVEAAKANDIDDKSIATLIVPSDAFSTPFGPGVGVLALELDKAQLKHRMKISKSVTDAAKAGGLIFDQIGVAYIVDDCLALDRAAIADAAEDAEQQATLMADVVGVTLGDLIAVEKSPSYQSYGGGNSGNACADIASLESAQETYFPAFNPAAKAELELYEYLTFTYAIG